MAVVKLRSTPEGTTVELSITTAEAARIAAGDTTFTRGEELDRNSDAVEVHVHVSKGPATQWTADGT